MSISIVLVMFLNVVIMTGYHMVLKIVVFASILAIANCLCVKLQMKSSENKQSCQQKNTVKSVFSAIGLAVLGLAVNIALVIMILPLTSSVEIADTNGEDISLVTITQEDILVGNTVSVASAPRQERYGRHTNVKEDYSHDYDKCTYESKNVSGIVNLQMTNIDTDALILNIESTLQAGNMEIYIIVDDTIYEKVPIGQAYTTNLSNIANEDVIVRFGAESANMSIAVTREYEGVANDFSENHFRD